MRKKLIKVPYIDQTKEWPTGCESVSAVMFLQYLGLDISVQQFVEQYLEKSPLFERDKKLYGPDPRKVFAGDPADESSMGCYAPVIKRALEKVFEQNGRSCGKGSVNRKTYVQSREVEEISEMPKENFRDEWEVLDLTGVSMETLLQDYIDCDIPVIFWASIDLQETCMGPEWTLTDSGEIFVWRSNEHCMLLVGYDGENYYFNDPWHNHGTVGYERELVERRHAEQYQMAVSVRRC